jgi:hypothetical protein
VKPIAESITVVSCLILFASALRCFFLTPMSQDVVNGYVLFALSIIIADIALRQEKP